MPAYTYHAINPLGRNVQGVIEAESERAARSQLRQQSLVTVKLQILTLSPTTRKGDIVLWQARVFSRSTLAVWTRQLASLVSAGLPLERALSALLEQADTPAQRELQAQVRAEVNAGAPLAVALSQNKRLPGLLPMFASLGEQTGQLPQMLQHAADHLSEEVQRRAMQLATILEPLLIVTMGAVVMLIVLAVMLPIIQLNQFVR